MASSTSGAAIGPSTPRGPSKSPDAIRQGKRLLSQFGQVSMAEAFADEARTMASLIGSPNQVESVTAYFEKRDPVYED